MAYKKQLSVFELQTLIEEHKESGIFRINRKGERTLEPWLKELRFKQAIQVAESILAEPVNQQEFRECWKRTRSAKAKPSPPEPPNTATFGGYRLRQRPALWMNQSEMAACFCRGDACVALGRACPAPTIVPCLTAFSIRSRQETDQPAQEEKIEALLRGVKIAARLGYSPGWAQQNLQRLHEYSPDAHRTRAGAKKRSTEVQALIEQGMSYREIVQTLNTSYNTVRRLLGRCRSPGS